MDAGRSCVACGLPDADRLKSPPPDCPMRHPDVTCPQRVRTSGYIRTLPRDHEANLTAHELMRRMLDRVGKP